MTNSSLIEDLRSGELTLPDFVAQAEARFTDVEPRVQAFIPEESRFERVRAEADELIHRYPDLISRPDLFGALAGVKDIFHVNGYTTQAGSRLPAELLQGEQAESVTRLREAGALILGKTVTTEFAYFFPGPTRNPHNPEHTPGGSSSGSAAAVAAGLCSLALGTQTIGSIIRPASFCGVVGLKPTYDRIPRSGVIPLSPSLDHIGVFAPDVGTTIRAARVLYNNWDEPTAPLKKPVIGIPDGPYLQITSDAGLAHFEETLSRLQSAGYDLHRIPLMADIADIRARHDVIMSAEAAQVHAEWFGEHEALYSAKFQELVKRGQGVTGPQLAAALAEREEFRAELRRVFLDNDLDLWICPSTVGPAPKGLESTGDPVMNLPWTQAGLPAINLPSGHSADGLPLGLQLVGNWYKDESLLFWAGDIEKVLSSE